MCYIKKLEIYKIKGDVVTPLASSPSISANCSIGDYLIIDDNKVWIKDWNDDREEQYALAHYTADFIKMNPNFFEKID